MKAGEDKASFIGRAMKLVRLFVEEALRRSILHANNPLRKAGLCTIAVTMHNFEVGTLADRAESLGGSWTLSEYRVREMASAVAGGLGTSISMMPSYFEVMNMADMRVEAFSLLLVNVQPMSIRMSKAEVKHAIEAICGPLSPEELARLPGSDEPSVFEGIFGVTR